MTSKPNHRRGHSRVQERGPTWENASPGGGCNSTHVARARKKWKNLVRRAERRTEEHWSKFKGARYRLPAATTDEHRMPNPDIEALVGCGRKLASMLDVPAPPDSKIRGTIRTILEDKGYSEAVHMGIITRLEACNVLLAHLQSLVCGGSVSSGVALPDAELTQEVEDAWFAGKERDAP